MTSTGERCLPNYVLMEWESLPRAKFQSLEKMPYTRVERERLARVMSYDEVDNVTAIEVDAETRRIRKWKEIRYLWKLVFGHSYFDEKQRRNEKLKLTLPPLTAADERKSQGGHDTLTSLSTAAQILSQALAVREGHRLKTNHRLVRSKNSTGEAVKSSRPNRPLGSVENALWIFGSSLTVDQFVSAMMSEFMFPQHLRADEHLRILYLACEGGRKWLTMLSRIVSL